MTKPKKKSQEVKAHKRRKKNERTKIKISSYKRTPPKKSRKEA